MSQTQFGIWSAIAIHDTSSVVGAAAKYGSDALQIATTVKLTRALWIVPVTLGTAFAFRGRTTPGEEARPKSAPLPWFILFFVIASVLRTYASGPMVLWNDIGSAAKVGLTVTLFLIGTNLSRKAIRSVGARPLLLGVILWVAISCTSLWAVLATVR